MSCLYPIVIKTPSGKTYNVPCRHCLNCRISYQTQLEFMCKNELYYTYRSGHGASFVCFTYSDANLPVNGSLCKSDLQLFIKDLRRYSVYHKYNSNFKYIACGEYGDTFGRPHYHVVFIGLSDVEINTVASKCWTKGLIDVGALGQGGLRYVLKYCEKSVGGKLAQSLYENNDLQRPFLMHSVNLGKQYILDNFEDISAHNFTYLFRGERVPLPKYLRNKYDKYKLFDSSVYLKKIQLEAKSFGFDDYQKYEQYKSYNREKEMTQTLRDKGYFVDDSDLRLTNRVVFDSIGIKSLASSALV